MSDELSPESYESNGRTNDGEAERINLRLMTAISRGAAVGFVLRGGLTILVSLLSILMKRKRKSDRNQISEIIRMTLFLATLAGSYVITDETVSRLWGKKKTASWRGLLAGFLAGPTILLLGKDIRHDSLAFYVLVRSLTLLVRCGNREANHIVLRSLLSPTRMKHGDVLLMCLTGAQIIYSYVMMPQTLPKSYRNFLTRQTCRPTYVWETLKEMASSENCAKGIPDDGYVSLEGTGHVPFFSSIPCNLLHPNKNCLQNILSVFPESYLRALTVYLPVYIAPALLVHRKDFFLKNKTLLPKVVFGILRSSLFLSSAVVLAFTGCCVMHNLTGYINGWTLSASLLLVGLALFAEKRSRRMELSLYVLSRAAESFSQSLVDWGYLTPTKWRSDVLLFSLASAFITHSYSDGEGCHRHAFKSKYLNVLDFVFGNSGIPSGEIHHVPSNQDLLDMGSHWWNQGWFGKFIKWN